MGTPATRGERKKENNKKRDMKNEWQAWTRQQSNSESSSFSHCGNRSALVHFGVGVQWWSLVDQRSHTKKGQSQYSRDKTGTQRKYLLSHTVMPDECSRQTVECSKGAYSLQSPLLQKTQSLSLHTAPHSYTVNRVAMMVIMVVSYMTKISGNATPLSFSNFDLIWWNYEFLHFNQSFNH